MCVLFIHVCLFAAPPPGSTITRHVFATAQHEIEILLRDNLLPRFRSSHYFSVLMKRVRDTKDSVAAVQLVCSAACVCASRRVVLIVCSLCVFEQVPIRDRERAVLRAASGPPDLS